MPAAGEIVFFDRSWYNRALDHRALGHQETGASQLHQVRAVADRLCRQKGSAELFEVDSDIIISGIDELKMMEDNLTKPKSLPG